VISPSITAEEIAEKRAFYFEAGAKEVWLCDMDGRMSFYLASELAPGSDFTPASRNRFKLEWRMSLV
jgi:hypothetical protein